MNKVLFFNYMEKKFRGKFEKIINQFLTYLIKMILKINLNSQTLKNLMAGKKGVFNFICNKFKQRTSNPD